MTLIIDMKPKDRRRHLLLLALWRATGENLNLVASEAAINEQLALLGQNPVDFKELWDLHIERLIGDVNSDNIVVTMRESAVEIAEEAAQQATDSKARRTYLRKYLLNWIYEEIDDRGESRAVLNKLHAEGFSYYGSAYTEIEIRRAAEYLEDHVWIHGLRSSSYLPMEVKLTSHGRAKAEGEPEFDATPTHLVNHTYNNSNVAINSTNVTQSIDNSIHNGEGVESILYLVRQWMREIDDYEQRQSIGDAVANVEAAVSDEDKSVLRRSMEGLGEVVRESAVGAAGQAGGTGILMGIQYALQVLGVG